MKKFCVAFVLVVLISQVCFILSASAQTPETSEEIFTIVEDQPTFPGGSESLSQYLSNNLQYPETAYNNKVEGTVYVTFVVEKDGTVSNVKIRRGIHPDCDAEVIRVISEMPKWNSGKQRGKPVRVQFNLPVKFRL